jgi:CRP/FNR family transcriptional regulator, cyclic AMP receptor protein
MAALRGVAIASNFAFIAYGALADVLPVLLLHVVLLPVNLLRLAESVRSALRHRAEAATAPHRPSRFTPPARPEWHQRTRSRRRAAGASAPRPCKQETI